MRRSPFEGSVQDRGRGVWRLRLTVRGADGTTLRITKTVHAKRKTDALAELRRWRGEAEKGRGSDPTLAKVGRDWIKNLEREGRLAPSTILTYRRWLTGWIIPALGTVPLSKLTGRRIDDFYASLDGKIKPATIGLVHATLMGVFRQAADWGLIARERIPVPKPPQVPQEVRTALTPYQVRELVSGAKERNLDALAMLLALGAVTGGRRGELLGLRVEDVTRQDMTVTIRRQVTNEHGVRDRLKSGKTRTIAISADTITLIDDWLDSQRERFGFEPGPWLLSDDGGESHLMPNRVSENIARLGHKLKIPVTTHSLRHFHDTHLSGAGVDIVTVARRAGHRPEEALRTYVHPLVEADRRAAEVLGAVLNATNAPDPEAGGVV